MVAGYIFPNLFLWGPKITDKLLMFSFFLGCLRIDFDEVVHLKSNYYKLFLFAGVNLVLLPVIIYYATPYLGQDTRIGVFLIMATAGGMLTPLIASFMGLNVLWAVVYVIVTSSLVPFTLPLLTKILFGVSMNVSGGEMILFLSKIVFPPAILAYIVRKYLPKFSNNFMKFSGTIGSANMSLFIAIVIAQNNVFLKDNLFYWQTLPVLLLLCVIFVIRYLIGYYIINQSVRERWSNSLLFGVMNNGLVILFASQYFSEQVLYITLLSEIPWILAQPVFSRIYLYRNK